MSYIKYKTPTANEFKEFSSETAKYRHICAPYCAGVGVDIASQGVQVVPWAVSFDLPEKEFLHYSSGQPAKGPIHLRGQCTELPFETASLDFLYASHILEDFEDWVPVIAEWSRCVRVGGNLIILIPDKKLWSEALAKGQAPNCSHRHEGHVGELSNTFRAHFGHFEILKDELTAITPEDYTILFVARRLR